MMPKAYVQSKKGNSMNLGYINRAIEAYRSRLAPDDLNRLEFFNGIWNIQEAIAQKVAAAIYYKTPNAEVAEVDYWQGKPIFLSNPATIDIDLFVAALQDCSRYLVKHAGFNQDISDALQAFDWLLLLKAVGCEQAGSDPAAFIETCCSKVVEFDDTPDFASIIALVLALGLRPNLEPAAAQIMQSLKLKESSSTHKKPLRCPICGSLAAAASVGLVPSGIPNGKLLYCASCGTNWEFERIRCARCGTQNQGKLHYFHVEGDDAHRLYLCNECDEYTRTVFQKELEVPFVFEVEDVVMARLDSIAQDSRFKA
jgi:FdhE protein